MRTTFPGHFRPTKDGFETLWTSCIFAVDANVILNLYRYSQATRQELEKALTSVKGRLFIPHQAAREFLRNRLGVTAGQAEEYTKAIKTIRDLRDVLTNKKRHPFLPDSELLRFNELTEQICKLLDAHKVALLDRLVDDEILEFAEATFFERTGEALDDEAVQQLIHEGEGRYQSDVPPGYRDGKKDSSGDPNRKFGDLIVWKQLIQKSKSSERPLIFITDDKKDDWWLEQSGRTIGPRPELLEEFLNQAGQAFWMYSVDKFIAETARASNVAVNEEAIAEIIETREVAKSEAAAETEPAPPSAAKILRPVLSEEELLHELQVFLASHPSEDDSVGLRYFVVNYLGNQNYEVNHSYARLNALAETGHVEIFKREKNGVPITWIRLAPTPQVEKVSDQADEGPSL
jgi:hypothetical protein